MTIPGNLLFIAGAATALLFSTGVARAQCGTGNPVTCTSTGSAMTLTDNDIVTQPVEATTCYPSAIVVPNTITGTVSNITVRLNGLTASATGQGGEDEGVTALGILLVNKTTGKNLELMYAPGDATVTFTNVTFNIADSATSFMPTNGDNCGNPDGVAFPSQSTYTYKPSSFEAGNVLGSYPGFSSINRAGPCFETTLNTLNEVFDGVTAAGEWDLYVDNNGVADVSITSWSLILTTANAASTTTTLSSSVNPSFTVSPNNSTTLTADVTSGVNAGTVAFSDGGTVITNCSAQAVNSSGIATCAATFTTQGFHALSAAYSGTSTFAPSTGTLNQFVEFHPTVTGTQFCNTGAIGIPATNASGADTQPYPSVMNVTGISQSVSTVQVVLNGLTTSEILDLSMLLVSPDGNHALDFFDFVGGGVASSSTSVTFSDTASGLAPMGSGGLASGTPSYQPTSYRSSPSFLDPPAPAPQVPATFANAATGGGTSAKTFLEAFNGATADGAWSLYVYDHGNPNTTTISGGWCLAITPGVGLSTTTIVSGSPNGPAPNGAATGAPVTITAVVKNGATPVTTGSVLFTENGKQVAGGPAGSVNVATSGPTQGQASFTTSSLTEGDHTILATFTDSSNTYSESFGTFVQRVDDTPTVTVNGTAVSYCNAGKITVPNPENASDLGAGFPNPSNINIGNMFGTIKTVTVSLNGYSEGQPDFLTSLLVGPAATTGATLDFFSGAGGPNPAGPFNLVFSDAASSSAPQNTAISAGTFKPSSYNNTANTYTPTISGFYTLPATYDYAAAFGTSTFASVFQGTNPNGNWDLYFNQTGDNPGGGLATGWCLNFTANPPALAITKTHTGNFVQGQQGAQFAITVTNNGPGNAGGAIAVTVADTMPTGLTPVSGSGTGWNCAAPSGQTITCTNANVVASGNTFPALTLTVNVAVNAPGSVNNTASVNGSGNTVAVNSNTNPVTIVPAPILGISKAPSGTFTQGQTAIWDITVFNSASASSTTSGTVTVVDTLPAGYTLASNTGTGWTCGAVTVTITCTSTTAVAGDTSFPTLAITVNVPSNSAISVTNNAAVFGGGDLTHTSLGTAATTFSTVTVAQVPATINITAGNNQSVTIGSALPTNLAVTVLDAGGVAINGATVTFTAPATGASGTFAGGTNVKTATTNSSGVATATVFTTNFVAGSYMISAAAGSISNHFSVTNNPGAASIMTANAGTTPQSTSVNTAFGNALAVTVTDSHNNPVSGVVIQFTAPGSGASGLFSNSSTQFSPMTNSSGVATAPFTANSTAGGYSVTAVGSGLTPVSFSLTNIAGGAASITPLTGTTPQAATVNLTFAVALAVTVRDAGSNPISGANVVFTAPSTGASGTFNNSTNTITVPTNASGVASAAFTANGIAGGPYSVTAMVGGVGTFFSLTNTAVVQPAPTVVSYKVLWGSESYNVIGSPRNRLPWQITGIQAVFSSPIASGDANSLSGPGITTTGFSGLGTNTLTWTISPIALGNFSTFLAGSGADALKDMNGNALANGAGYNQNLKILYGDFNDDGVVNAQDGVGVNSASSAAYNIFADMNGDGVVNVADVRVVASRIGTSLP